MIEFQRYSYVRPYVTLSINGQKLFYIADLWSANEKTIYAATLIRQLLLVSSDENPLPTIDLILSSGYIFKSSSVELLYTSRSIA